MEAQQERPMELWRLVKADPSSKPAIDHPLIDGFALEVGSSTLDPAKGSAVIFAGPLCNGGEFCLAGFETPLPGDSYVLTSGKMGLLHFVAAPVSGDAEVEVRLDFVGALLNTRHPVQRLRVSFNGSELGNFVAKLGEPFPDLRVRVPAVLWNAAHPLAFLTLDFPDAVAPADIDNVNKDTRVIAFDAKKITFRLTEPVQSVAPPQ